MLLKVKAPLLTVPFDSKIIDSLIMKTEIHPIYYPKAKIRCACGATYTIGSTRESMNVEICAKCHPFYTGKDKLMDVAGRVEKFKSREAKAKAKQTAKPTDKKTKTVKKSPPKALKTPTKKKK